MKKETKILYLIFATKNTKGGGHFYSLKTIFQAVNSKVPCEIIQIGYSEVLPLKKLKDSHFIKVTNSTIFWKLPKLIKETRKISPTVIHAFDHRSLFVGKILGYILRKPVVYTKCGGVNDGTFIPIANRYILFSEENFKHFERYKPSGTSQFLIPNRSEKVENDLIRIKKLREELKLGNEKIILRISRFNEYYEKTFYQSIELLNEYLKTDNDCKLIFIGAIQSDSIFLKLKKETERLPVYFVTDDYYTKDASQLIDISEIVVATGRGVMEAASLDKLIYCPIKDSKIPIKLTANNFEFFFRKNFSERVENHENLWKDGQNVKTIELFYKYFDINMALDQYIDIYKSVEGERLIFGLKDFFRHSWMFLKPKIR